MRKSTDDLAYNPGKLRHAIQIQAQGPTSPPTYDAAGPVLQWTTVLSTHAAIEPMHAQDVIRSGQTISQVEIPIRIRYSSLVQANMRVVLASRGDTYIIRGMINVQERNRWLVLMCVGLGANE